jgi:ketosteroid isomerase-like protein
MDAEAFARSWIDAWNAHDLDAVLAHFADDVTFSSPLIATLMGEPSATVHGKAALRAYWEEGLRRIPDLRFELVAVHAGVDIVTISYRNQAGRSCVEAAVLDGDRVVRGWGLYS